MADISRYERGRRLSRAVVCDGIAYFSGLTAQDRSGKIEAQTREVLDKADALLSKVGARRSGILSAMIWLRDMEDLAGMNMIWEEWIDPDHPPARATVASKLASADIRIEIQLIVAVR